MTTSASAGRLIGRAGELDRLRVTLRDAQAGTARIATIVGEPGVGKTRLAAELLRSAGDCTVLTGTASPLQHDLAYGPVVEALRPLVRQPRFTKGLTELGRLFDGLDAPPDLGDAVLSRTRLFEAVRTLLDRAGQAAPLVWLLDDAHWADRDTVALLGYLCRGLADRPFLLLLTSRHADAELLGQLRRSPGYTETLLAGLSDVDIAAMAAGMLDGEPPDELIALLAERAAGVPLFAESILGMLLESKALHRLAGRWVLRMRPTDVPPLVDDILRARIDALPAHARTVLDALAVCAGPTAHELLAEVIGDEDGAMHGVRALLRAGLLGEDLSEGQVRYRLTHPMLGEVAYRQLPAALRRRMHATVFAVLCVQQPNEHSLLAHHVRGAGTLVDDEQALHVLAEATQHALRRGAGDEAISSAGAAAGLARRCGRPTEEFAEQLARGAELTGRRGEACAAWYEAASQASDPLRKATRLCLAGAAAWDVGDFPAAQRNLDEASAQLADLPPGPEHEFLAETRLRHAMRGGDLVAVDREWQQAKGLSEVAGTERSRALLLLGRLELLLAEGRYVEADESVQRLLEFCPDNPRELEQLLRPAAQIATCRGDFAAARGYAERGLRLTTALGEPALETIHRLHLASVALLTGHVDEAMSRCDELLALCQRLGIDRGTVAGLGFKAVALVRQGKLAETQACIEEAYRLFAPWADADRHAFSIVELTESMLALARNDIAGAAHFAKACTSRNNSLPPLMLLTLARVQLAAGELEEARHTAHELGRLGPQAPWPQALASYVHGRCDRAVGETERATRRLTEAAERFASLRMPLEEGQARMEIAELATDPGVDTVNTLLARFQGLRAGLEADRARQLLRALGQRPAPETTQPAGRLSARELEVARLVAEGLSNAVIADRLFISQRTVTTHLHNLYRRLGLTSRAALTRYVIEHAPPANT